MKTKTWYYIFAYATAYFTGIFSIAINEIEGYWLELIMWLILIFLSVELFFYFINKAQPKENLKIKNENKN